MQIFTTPRNFKIHALASSLLLALTLAACGPKTPEARIEQAKQALDRADYQTAIIGLKTALQDQPNNVDARILLGKAHYLTGDLKAAEKELIKARSLGARLDVAVPLLAKTLLNQGKYQLVLDETKIGPTMDPATISILHALRATALISLKRDEEAREALQRGDAADPGQPELLLAKSRFASVTGEKAEAMKWVDMALQADPRFIDAMKFKARLLRADLRDDEERAVHQAIIKIDPSIPEIWVALAELDMRAGKLDDAARNVKKAEAISPKNLAIKYAQAMVEFRRGHLKEANDAILQVLKVAPDHLPSVLLQSLIDLNLGRYEQAKKRAQLVLARQPQNIVATRVLAETQLKLGYPREALATLSETLKTEDAFALALAGEAYQQMRDYPAAIRYFEQAVTKAPGNLEYRTKLAVGRLAHGDTEKALAEMETLASQSRDVTRTDYLLINTYIYLSQFDKALAALATLDKKRPDDPIAQYLRGMVYLARHDNANARKAFEHALKLRPSFFEAAANLAQLDLLAKRPDAARQRYESVLKHDASSIPAILALAELYAQAGHESDYVQLLQRAAKADPSASEPRNRLVAHYLAKNKPQQALSVAQDAISANPDNPVFIELLGRTELVTGNHQNALTTFRKLVKTHPSHAPSHFLVAQAQLALQDMQGARDSLGQALAINPDFPDALITMAGLEIVAKRYDKALDMARAFQKRQPEVPGGYALEGDIRFAQGDFAKAASAYDKAYRLQPNSRLAMQISDALALAGDVKAAVSRLELWLTRQPKDLVARYKLGTRLLESGQYEAAIIQMLEVLKGNPNNHLALNSLAWLYQQTGDKRALATAEQAYKLRSDDPAIQDTYGWILVQQGQLKLGTQLLRQAVSKLPQPGVHYRLAVALATSGDKAGARQEVEAALKFGQPFPERKEAQALLQRLY